MVGQQSRQLLAQLALKRLKVKQRDYRVEERGWDSRDKS
jgi:hypothetical protein